MTSDTRTGVSIEDVVLFDPPPSRRSFAAGDVVRLVVGLVLIAAGLVLSRAARATLPDTLEDGAQTEVGAVTDAPLEPSAPVQHLDRHRSRGVRRGSGVPVALGWLTHPPDPAWPTPARRLRTTLQHMMWAA